MKIDKFINEKALAHLAKIDLSEQAEKLRNFSNNLLDDLPHYLVSLKPEKYFSELLDMTKRMAETIYLNGNTYISPKVRLSLEKSYIDFVNNNKDLLVRDLSCALTEISSSDMNVKKDDAFWQFLCLRKLNHKAWANAKWKGETCGKDFWEFAKENYVGSEVKIKKYTPFYYSSEKATFNKKGGCLYRLPEGRKYSNVFWLRSPSHTLSILKIGRGEFDWKTDNLPVYIQPHSAKNSVFIVAQDSEKRKHLALFPDISICALQAKLGVVDWNMYSLWTRNDTYSYVLRGTDSNGALQIEIYGISPIVHPRFVK